jgi:O-antigen/teichoic acid export membrane protein
LKNQIVVASYWSVFAEIIAKVIGPLGFLVLTKILSPNDFGIVAVATTILGFLIIISDFGIGKVLIQERHDIGSSFKIYNVAFWINTILGFIFFLIMFIFSQNLAIFFGNINSTSVIKVMSFQVLFSSISTVQISNKNKELNFRFLFIIRLLTVATPFLISIPIAFSGGGYWAIVWGQVIGSLLNTIVLWSNSSWYPSFDFDFNYCKKIIEKSSWNTLEQFFVWVPIGIDTFLISKFLTPKDLGLYTTSRTLFSTAISISVGALVPVMFSVYARINSKPRLLKNTLLSNQKIIFTFSCFTGVSVFLFKDIIEIILFNNNWNGISEIFSLVFLILGFSYFSGVLSEGLKAKGFFKITAINTTLISLLSLPILFISVKFGLIFYVVSRLLLLYLKDIVIFHFAKLKLDISFLECVNNTKSTILCFGSLLLISIGISQLNFDILIESLVKIILLVLHIILLIFLEKEEFLRIKGLFFNDLFKKS